MATSTRLVAKSSADRQSLYVFSPALSSSIGAPFIDPETSSRRTQGKRGSGFSAKLLVPKGVCSIIVVGLLELVLRLFVRLQSTTTPHVATLIEAAKALA